MLPPSSSKALRLAEPRTGATSGGSGPGPADSAGCASTDSAGEDVPGRPAVTAVPGDGEPGATVVDAVVVGSADPAAPNGLPAVGDATAVPLGAGEPLDDAVADAVGVPVARGVGRGVRGDGVAVGRGVGGAVDGGGAVAVGVGGGVAWVTTTAFDRVRLG
jgi:hypothetical protein